MTIIEERTVLVGNQSAENWRRENAPDGLSHHWNPFESGFELAAIGALAKSARVMPPPASSTSAGATHDYAVENVVLGDEGHHRQRRSKRADALIAGAYFAGTSTRRRRRGEGHGQPGLAQGKGRLGRLEWPFARR